MSERDNDKRVLVIGCGIAGPALALFLKRAGFVPVIFEADRQWDEFEGLFLNLASNGLNVLKELGIDRAVAQEGIPMRGMRMLNGKGRMLGELGDANGPVQGYTLKRGYLHKVLRDEAERQGISILYGKRLKDIENKSGHSVTAFFEDGSSETGKLLVGCDGIHSKVRSLILPDAPKPSYTGLISYGGFSPAKTITGKSELQTLVFGKRAFFGYVENDTETYWFGNMNMGGLPTRRELMLIPQAEWRSRINHLHEIDADPVPRIVQATKGGIGVFPIYDIPKQPLWHKGSVVLIGDAVHATSPSAGQGASLALEDAVVLAKCLRDIPYSPKAFERFQELRKERVEKIVQYARSIGQRKHATNPVQVFFRDRMLPLFLKSAKSKTHSWMYDYRVDWNQRTESV
ncbi:FAD-dependent oxidoreductase [Paenibacillus arenilitoris]|uniref:FAD-dependent monooxygenase n=1 Tax=Paenibacillus arenilitoris TaxID=2772299 RepID=A0A927CQ78_9BACL|nr:FAD-dependent monooxygenase [Paenibacillus arenilitoris]MBD2871734.1 FAD-dependent monooxygenase [Paenibacillus arenilitoris]